VALWQRSSPATVRWVWFLCGLAVAMSVIYFRQLIRGPDASAGPNVDGAVSEWRAPGSPAQPALTHASPSHAPEASPSREADVRLSAVAPAAMILPPVHALPAEYQHGRDALDSGDAPRARQIFANALGAGLPGPVQEMVRDELARASDQSLFSRQLLPGDALVGSYTVRKGDTLVSIGRQFRVTDDLLAMINGLSSKDRLMAGSRLKVVYGPFRAVVVKRDFRMDVLADHHLVRSFPVGLGVDGRTPTGRWIVRDKLANPGWTDPRTGEYYPPDAPDNPIGEYWIGLEGVSGDAVGKRGFGIHGTIEPDSIGRDMSLGCVRLGPADIELLYRLLVIGDSTVEIVD
jgi:LysM repeat protein